MLDKFKKFFAPVPVECRALVPFNDEESEVSLKIELERLKSEINYIRDAMAKEQAFRDEMFEEMNPVLYELIEKLERLKARHEAYKYEARRQSMDGTFDSSKMDDDDFTGEGSDRDFIDGIDEEENEEVKEARLSNRATRKACSKLFKKISNLTHPDKNGGSDILGDIFHAAYEAYQAQDLEALEAIWNEVKSSKSNIKSIREKSRQRLKMMVEEYRKLHKTVSMEMQGFMSGEDAILATIYRKSGLTAVTSAYRRMLVASIEEYEDALENMRYASTSHGGFDSIDESFDEDGDDWDWGGDY